MGYVTYVKDTLRNFVTGLGQLGVDPSKSVDYIFTPLDRNTLDNMYRGDWLARRICDMPADDMTREWRAWQASPQQIEKLEEAEKAIALQRKTKEWLIRARLYGGAALLMGVDDGNDPAEPLDLERCKKDCLKYLIPFSCFDLSPGERIINAMDPYYGRPSYYSISANVYAEKPDVKQRGTNVVPLIKRSSFSPGMMIHPSRVIVISGNELPDWNLGMFGGEWGDSILQTVVDTLNSFTQTVQSTAAIVADCKLDIVKIPQMSESLTDKDYKNRLIERFTLSAQTKSVISALLLDKEEEWDRLTPQFSGLPNLLHEFFTLVAGAAGIPVSILFGQAYGRGLEGGSTGGGQDDVRSYYDNCANKQKNDLTSRIEPLDKVLVRHVLGKDDPKIHYDWRPLWQMSEADKSAIAYQKAQATQIYAGTGLINPDALRDGVVNQLVEDGTYPGFEDAIEEHGAEPEMGDPTGGFMPGGQPPGGQPPGGQPQGNGGPPANGGGNNGAAPKMSWGGLATDEGPGHPFRGNQYTSGESGGEQQLSEQDASEFIKLHTSQQAIKEVTANKATQLALSTGLALLLGDAMHLDQSSFLSGRVIDNVVTHLSTIGEMGKAQAKDMLERTVEGLIALKSAAREGHILATGVMTDADDPILEALKKVIESLKRTKVKDEEAGHPFRGNQYTQGESGGGKQKEESGRAAKKEEDLPRLAAPTEETTGPHPGGKYSDKAWVDKNGTIHTDDIHDATRALFEKRNVELNQPVQVSTLIDHLGKVAAEMEKLGGKAPNFDLCRVSVKGTNLFCAESKPIARVKMPQFNDNEHALAFVKYLQEQGYKISSGQEPAANLRATQRQLKGATVAGIMGVLRSGNDPTKLAERPIIVSKDNYILDGHHTWAAKIGLDAANNKLKDDTPMNIFRVNIGTMQMLHLANKFTKKAGRKSADAMPWWMRPFVQDEEAGHPFHGNQYVTVEGAGIGHTGLEGGVWNAFEVGGAIRGAVKGLRDRLLKQIGYIGKQLFQHTDENPNDPVVRKLAQAQIKLNERLHALHHTGTGSDGTGAVRDVIVVGTGPAGLSAGIYGGSEGLNTYVAEANPKAGGQAGASSRIENMLGFPIGVSGGKLGTEGVTQARRLGAQVEFEKRATGLSYDDKTGLKTVTFADGTSVQGRTVVIAGGVQFNKATVPGADSPDVVYGSSADLKERTRDNPTVVIGGANSAGQAAMDLATKSKHVTMVARSGIGDMSRYLRDQIAANPRISVTKGEIAEIRKDTNGRMTGAVLKDGSVITASGALYAIGSKPKTDWASGVERDAKGFIKTGGSGKDELETNIPGVYAVGDVRSGGRQKRIVHAISDGAAAIGMTHGYLEKAHGITGDAMLVVVDRVDDRDDAAQQWFNKMYQFDMEEQHYTGMPAPGDDDE